MNTINLNGDWNCTLPDGNKFRISVPGCFDTYTDKKDIAEMVSYVKEVNINFDNSKKYFIYFGGVSYYSDLYINNRFVTNHEGMWDNFRVDISEYIIKGSNIIKVEVTKPGYYDTDRFPLRQVLSGFIPDVLCTFGGIWDDVYIEEFENILVDYHYGKGSFNGDFSIEMKLLKGSSASNIVDIYTEVISPDNKTTFINEKEINTNDLEEKIIIRGNIPDCKLWSTNEPNLYKYTCKIQCGKEIITIDKKFGFRDIKTNGSKLMLNNKPLYLRGILHWGYYDKEIMPNPAAETIQKEINGIKSYGFNAVKHCLYIPREEYLNLADENGIALWIEFPLWLPEKSDFLSERIRREYPRLIRQLEGHPSIILTSLGCELDDKVDGRVLEEMYNLVKEKTDTLVNDNSGSGECYDGLNTNYGDYFDYHFYGDLENIENLMENFTPAWRNTKPWLYGEFCDSDTMRDLADIRKSYGVPKLIWESGDIHSNPICVLKPDFFADKHDKRMLNSGIRENIEKIKELSINHSMVHRKITLELTRAYSKIDGYNITTLRDVPLCANGIFDDTGKAKFNTKEFSKFNNDIVLSPAWDLTRIWLNGDRVMSKERFNFYSESNYSLHIIMSNYSPEEIINPLVEYRLKLEGKSVITNKITSTISFSTGDVLELCNINFKLPKVAVPKTLVLEISVIANGQAVTNEWPIFVYPEREKFEGKVGVYDPVCIFRTIKNLYNTIDIKDEQKITDVDAVVTSRLSPNVLRYIENGGKAILVQRGEGILPVTNAAFWREGMLYREFDSILNKLEYKHWADDLRFYSVSTDTAFDFSKFSEAGITDFKPMLRRYDCREWLATDYMTEINYGKGKIIATTLRLEGNMGKEPMFIENNCLSKWILDSSLNYLTL
jgi:hypothetical protein